MPAINAKLLNSSQSFDLAIAYRPHFAEWVHKAAIVTAFHSLAVTQPAQQCRRSGPIRELAWRGLTAQHAPDGIGDIRTYPWLARATRLRVLALGY